MLWLSLSGWALAGACQPLAPQQPQQWALTVPGSACTQPPVFGAALPGDGVQVSQGQGQAQGPFTFGGAAPPGAVGGGGGMFMFGAMGNGSGLVDPGSRESRDTGGGGGEMDTA
jgi:hypothetical protein